MDGSGGSRGGAQASPLFLDQTEARKAEQNFFFKTAPSPLSQVLNDCAPLPPLSEGLDPPLDGAAKERAYPLSCLTTSKLEMSTQDGIIFKDSKCVISISTRPKDKEKPNNNISVGKDA